ncbi:uncharacterized protein VNE69_09042 [Vairimorpha necatrix]|uniref:Uncharacterized protein n=1 Tax=Vairimorpha necatrix TaxID=6039 RepID=A0AAX4JF60_9MICR
MILLIKNGLDSVCDGYIVISNENIYKLYFFLNSPESEKRVLFKDKYKGKDFFSYDYLLEKVDTIYHKQIRTLGTAIKNTKLREKFCNSINNPVAIKKNIFNNLKASLRNGHKIFNKNNINNNEINKEKSDQSIKEDDNLNKFIMNTKSKD